MQTKIHNGAASPPLGTSGRQAPQLDNRSNAPRPWIERAKVSAAIENAVAPMLGNARKSTLAIGVYSDVGALCRPISSLVGLGMDLDQVGLVAATSTLTNARRPSEIDLAEWQRVARLISEAEPIGVWPGRDEILATPRLADTLKTSANWLTSTRVNRARPYDPDATVELEHLIRGGHTILAIDNASMAQHRRAVHVLLASSHYPVETHELRLRS